MKEIIVDALRLLNPEQKRKGMAIIASLVFQSFLDFFSIASFLPVVFLIINPGFIESNNVLHSLYSYFEFTRTGNFIIAITLLVLLFALVKTIISYWITLVKARYAFRTGTELSSRAMMHYLESGYTRFTDADFSHEITRITNHPVTFANSLLLPIGNLLSEALIFVFIFICVSLYDIKIVLLLAAILIPIAFLYQLLKRNTRNISQSIKEKYPLSLKYAQQLVEALIEIKMTRKENYFVKRFSTVSEELSGVFTMDHVIQNTMVRLTEIVAAIVICILVIYTVLSGQSYQQSILALSIYAGASFRIIPSLNRIFLASFQIRAHEYLTHELKDLIHFKPASSNTVKTNTPVFADTLELKNVSFAYTNKHTVLQDLNISLSKGTKIALTGKSGEGKTTLLLILLGFLKDYKGEIKLDHKSISGDSLRNIMGYVPQNPYILDGTLAENIAFGEVNENINRSKILGLIHTLELQGLVRQLPQGIDSRIGEKGVKLSGGQRQRIALARVLYADADILLIDEATNQIHHALELEILSSLDALKAKGKTIIIITHKLSEQTQYDAIYRLEKGKLVKVM